MYTVGILQGGVNVDGYHSVPKFMLLMYSELLLLLVTSVGMAGIAMCNAPEGEVAESFRVAAVSQSFIHSFG